MTVQPAPARNLAAAVLTRALFDLAEVSAVSGNGSALRWRRDAEDFFTRGDVALFASLAGIDEQAVRERFAALNAEDLPDHERRREAIREARREMSL